MALGIQDPDKTDAFIPLRGCLQKGRKMTAQLISGCIQSEMPMAVLLAAVEIRIYPGGTFGAELIVPQHPTAKMLNRFQAWVHRRILLITSMVPRIVAMWELGVHTRLSTRVWRRALMLRERMRCQAIYRKEREISALSEKEPASWASGIAIKWASLPAAARPDWHKDGAKCPSKYSMQRFSREKLLPNLRRQEEIEWKTTSKQQAYWQRWDRSAWTVADLQQEPAISIRQLRAWAQLKLQGFLSEDGGPNDSPRSACRVCHADCAETAEHLILECGRAQWAVSWAAEAWLALGAPTTPTAKCLELLRHGGPTRETAIVTVKLAGKLAKIARHVRRTTRIAPREASSRSASTSSPSEASVTE